MISDSLTKGLQLLGLSDLASKIYLSLVKNPSQSIISLAKDFNTNRNAVYAAMKELEEIGLLYPKKEYERTQEVVSPSKIASLLETKRQQDGQIIDSFVSSLPTVLADLYSSKTTQVFKIFRTKEQIMAFMHQLYFDSKEEICFLGNEQLAIELIGFQFLKQVVAQRMKGRIPIRVLLSEVNYYRFAQKPSDESELRSYRKLPAGDFMEGNYHLVGNSVFIMNPIIPHGYLIQDPVVANMMRQMFNLLWKMGEGV